MSGGEVLYVDADEIAALLRSSPRGRALLLHSTPGGMCIDPGTRDEQGRYPRWIVLRLGILRDLDITSMEITDGERVELLAFAAGHGKELVG